MRKQVTRPWPLCIAVLSLGAAANATEAPELANNPFARPPSEVTIPDQPILRPDGSTQELDLRATMVGTRDKLANVAGKIIRPGDEVNGYRLVQVFEDRAVFARQGNRKTIYVKPDLEQDDE